MEGIAEKRKINKEDTQYSEYMPNGTVEMIKEYPQECKLKFWLSIVKITQLPIDDKIKGAELPSLLEEFGEEQFIIRISALNGMKIELVWESGSRDFAISSGMAKLNMLRRKFPGLDGTVQVQLMDIGKYMRQGGFATWSIELPEPPYAKKIPLMETIAAATTNIPEGIAVQFDILIQNEELEKKYEIIQYITERGRNLTDANHTERIVELWEGKTFQLNVYMSIFPKNSDSRHMKRNSMELDALDLYLTNSLVNLKGEKTRILNPDPINRLILALFNSSKGTIITDKAVDFSLGKRIKYPLRRSKKLPGENFTPLYGEGAGKRYLSLGKWRKDGVTQKSNVLVKYDSMTMNMLIAGNQGTGKTVLLRNILEQIETYRPKVGILVVNTTKRGEEKMYEGYRYINYSDPGFSIPYMALGRNIQKSIKHASVNLAGAFGLLEYSEKFFRLPLMDYYNLHLRDPEQFRTPVPESLERLMNVSINHIKNLYDMKTRERILGVVKQRIDVFRKDREFMKRVNYSDRTPDWFTGWLHRGEKIFLDLIDCSDDVKRFIVLALLQLIYMKSEDRNLMGRNFLQNIAVFDESHDIYRRPKVESTGSDSNEGQKSLNGFLEKVFTEFRSRSISTIISDQQPSVLMEAIATQPSIKILFNLRKKCAALYADAESNGFRQFLMEQRHHMAVVLNGITGERCWMETNPPSNKQIEAKSQGE